MKLPRLSRPRRPSKRRVVVWVLSAAFLGAWLFFLWPTSLGGRTGYILVHGTSMRPGLHTGDLVLTRERSSYHVGEVVAFRVYGDQVIHRLHSGDAASGFQTKGDNRTEPDPWTIKSNAIVGQKWIRIPGMGTILARVHNPITIVLVAGALVVLGMKTKPSKPDGKDQEPAEAAEEVLPVG